MAGYSAIKGGDLNQGRLFSMAFWQNQGQELAWGLFADVTNTDSFYSPDWPR